MFMDLNSNAIKIQTPKIAPNSPLFPQMPVSFKQNNYFPRSSQGINNSWLSKNNGKLQGYFSRFSLDI